MTILSRLALTCAIIVGFVSCATTKEDILNAKNDGTSAIYALTPEQCWDVSKAVLRWKHANVQEERKKDGYMRAYSPIERLASS